MYSVYALMDPRDEAIRYIGMSRNVWRRYAMHLLIPAKATPIKNAWIEELRKLDLSPLLKILETAETEEETGKKESLWIQHYLNEGAQLLNVAKTGNKRYQGNTDVAQVARYLGFSENTVVRLLRTKEMRGHFVSNTWRVKQEYVDEYLAKHLNTRQQTE